MNDKAAATQFVQELGIDAPRSVRDVGEDDLPEIANTLQFPVVVKATEASGVATGLRYANNLDELRSGYAAVTGSGRRPRGVLAQEYIPGFIHDACAMAVKGESIQVLTQIRRLMYPIYGGVGAINVTTHDAELDGIARRVLEASEWTGPTQIEFKKDVRDNRYKFIEFNPKFWGTSELSMKAGIVFPALARDLILGRPVERNRPYPAGVRFNFWMPLGVLAYAQLFREFGFRAFRTIAPFEAQYHDLDWRDPLPWVGNALLTVYALLRGRLLDVNRNIPRELINGPDSW